MSSLISKYCLKRKHKIFVVPVIVSFFQKCLLESWKYLILFRFLFNGIKTRSRCYIHIVTN